MRVLSVLGGRPHLVKAESVHRALAGAADIIHETVECWLGKQNDYPRSGPDDFELPEPARVIREQRLNSIAGQLDDAITHVAPHVILVYGDLRVSAVATAAAISRGIPSVHIESGYRSGDITDPEEETRIFVDHAVRFRIAFSNHMRQALIHEGISPSSIAVYGNCALQTLYRRLQSMAEESLILTPVPNQALVTFHHNENLCTPDRAADMVEQIRRLSEEFEIHLILYGRTREVLDAYGLLARLYTRAITIAPTMSYDVYIRELLTASFVVTDSSGLQDECAFLQKPCFVLRRATPRRERLGKMLRLCGDDERGAPLRAHIREALAASGSPSPDFSLLGRGYDDTFVRLLASLV